MQTPTDRLNALPLRALIADLLKQFKRLLATHDIELTKAEMDAIAEAAANHADLPPKSRAICAALVQLVDESVQVLQERFDLNFAQALRTDMSNIGGWETTADFLEVANHKVNAELRISAGSSLLVFLGDARHANHLLTVLHYDAGVMDVDAAIAKRALTHTARVNPHAADWLAQVKAWLLDLDINHGF